MVVYCRILALECIGDADHGRVGKIVPVDDSFRFAPEACLPPGFVLDDWYRVSVDGEIDDLMIPKDCVQTFEESEITQEVKIMWALLPETPSRIKYVITKGNEKIVQQGMAGTPHRIAPAGVGLLFPLSSSLKNIDSTDDDLTLLHVPDPNIATIINKLTVNKDNAAQIDEYLHTFSEANNEYISELKPWLEEIVESLKTCQGNILAVWTPDFETGDPHSPTVPLTDFNAGKVMRYTNEGKPRDDPETEADKADQEQLVSGAKEFPPMYSFFSRNEYDLSPQTLGDKILDAVFKGIYHIFPHPSIANCFQVLHAFDLLGKGCHVVMGSFMNVGPSSIAEYYSLRGTIRITDQLTLDLAMGNPYMFWNVLLQLEEYYEFAGPLASLGVLNTFLPTPGCNLKLLNKRTSFQQDNTGFLEPLIDYDRPTMIQDFESPQARRAWSEAQARVGVLLCFIEIAKRRKAEYRHLPIHFEADKYWKGTGFESDALAALKYLNEHTTSRSASDSSLPVNEMTCLLLNGGVRKCGGCGVTESSTCKLATCAGCGVAKYCGKECQKLDYKRKHRRVCKSLKEDREGKIPEGEIDYVEHCARVTQLAQDIFDHPSSTS